MYGRVGRTLEVVRRDDARVVALAGRVVLVRLARLGARADVREAEPVLAGDTMRHVGLVEDRDLQLAQPELNVPRTPMMLSSPAYDCALAEQVVGSHFAAAAVESSCASNSMA